MRAGNRVRACIGSANITSGGLGTNLEFWTYTESPEFAAAWATMRTDAKPPPLEPFPSIEAQIEQQRKEQREQIEAMRKSSAALPADQRQSIEDAIKQVTEATDAQQKDPQMQKLMRDSLLYSAERVPEISDRIVEIDRAMRWGYAHTYGPFELWDALGFTETARRMEADGLTLPASIVTMLSHGAKSFYRPADENRRPRTDYFDLHAGHFDPRPRL